MSCPNCKSDNYELVEILEEKDVDDESLMPKLQFYQAVQCLACGMRGPLFPQGMNEDEIDKFSKEAYELWDKISFDKEEYVLALAKTIPYLEKESQNYTCQYCHKSYEQGRFDKSTGYYKKHPSVEDFHEENCVWLKAWKYVEGKEWDKSQEKGY
jgi:hypothetical protein